VRLHWDEKICERATLDDIDEDKMRWFLERARYERRLDIEPNISIQEALERLELTRNGRVTNAAVLLFGKRPQRFFLQTETRCGRFKGIKPTKPFIDMKVFDGSIIDQVDAVEDFALGHVDYLTCLLLSVSAMFACTFSSCVKGDFHAPFRGEGATAM